MVRWGPFALLGDEPRRTRSVSPRAFSSSLHVPPSPAITQLRTASWTSGFGCRRSEQAAPIRSPSASRTASLHTKRAMVWWRTAEPTCRKTRILLPTLSLEWGVCPLEWGWSAHSTPGLAATKATGHDFPGRQWYLELGTSQLSPRREGAQLGADGSADALGEAGAEGRGQEGEDLEEGGTDERAALGRGEQPASCLQLQNHGAQRLGR